MELGQLAIGAAIGILVGCFFVWLLDRRHQKTIKKLIESRKKIERQRTQAVNDLFAYRSGEKPDARASDRRPPSAIPSESELMRQNAELQAEVSSLRTLIARADGALTAARRKRDEHEAEITRLQSQLGARGSAGSDARVIDLHASERPLAGSGPGGGLAL
jgi:septal ring factor EnvC (AmiA/AmiB activator)